MFDAAINVVLFSSSRRIKSMTCSCIHSPLLSTLLSCTLKLVLTCWFDVDSTHVHATSFYYLLIIAMLTPFVIHFLMVLTLLSTFFAIIIFTFIIITSRSSPSSYDLHGNRHFYDFTHIHNLTFLMIIIFILCLVSSSQSCS